jgi:hypothetical protein
VRVYVEGEDPKARVRVEPITDSDVVGKSAWALESFGEALQQSPAQPDFKALVTRFMALPGQYPGTSLSFGSGKTASVTLGREGRSILSLFSGGWAEMKPRNYVEQALGAGAPIFLDAVAQHLGPAYAGSWKQPTEKQLVTHGPALLDALEAALQAAGAAAIS